MHKVESRYLLMRHFWIHTDHLGMIERGNKPKILARGRHINVSPWLIGLGLQGELHAITALDIVFAEIVDGLAQVPDGIIGTAAGVRLNAFTSSPQYKNLCAQLSSQVHCAHGFLQSIGANIGIISGKRSIAKNGMKEKRDGRHGNYDPVHLASLLE